MTHDPYQTYPTVGAFSGLTNPFSSPMQPCKPPRSIRAAGDTIRWPIHP